MKNILLILILFAGIQIVPAQTLIWNNLSHPNMREVYGVAFTTDGQRALSGSECTETRLRMWDVPTGNLLWDYQLDSSMMCTAGVKFSSNGNYMAALEEFGNLFLFDVTGPTPQQITQVTTGTSGAFSVDFSPASDKVVTGCTNSKMIIYDVATGNLLHNITAHTGYVYSVAWSHNGQYIATAGQDNLVRLWDSSGVLIAGFSGHTADVFDVKFSPNDDYLISGSMDNSIKIWNRSTATLVHTISGHTGDVRSIAISPNGNYILSGATDATTRIWDFNTHAQLASFNNPGAGSVYTVAWSPTENKIITGTQNNQVLLWDITPSITSLNEEDGNTIINIYPNPVSNRLFIDDYDLSMSTVRIYSNVGKLVKTITESLIKGIYVEDLPSGVYTLEILDSKTSIIRKFIKE